MRKIFLLLNSLSWCLFCFSCCCFVGVFDWLAFFFLIFKAFSKLNVSVEFSLVDMVSHVFIEFISSVTLYKCSSSCKREIVYIVKQMWSKPIFWNKSLWKCWNFLFLTVPELYGSAVHAFKQGSGKADFPELEASGKKIWNHHSELSFLVLKLFDGLHFSYMK